ncbi:MAG TPA: hypothetical protein VNV63_05730, partial [Nitrospiria bacterium]|nr:hypothetical protein [Nitrospiria bacterium]
MTIENTQTGTGRGTAATLVFIDREQLLLDLVIGALQSDSLKIYGATDTDRGRQLVQMYSPTMV